MLPAPTSPPHHRPPTTPTLSGARRDPKDAVFNKIQPPRYRDISEPEVTTLPEIIKNLHLPS